MASRFVLPFADVGNGISPSDGAKFSFFDAGTSNPRDTFSDEPATTPNANPVISDGEGVFSDIWIAGSYKVVLTDKNGVQIWEADPVNESGLENVRSYDDTADMISDLTITLGHLISTTGFSTANDGGDTNYIIVAGGTGVADGILIIDLDNGLQAARLNENLFTFDTIASAIAAPYIGLGDKVRTVTYTSANSRTLGGALYTCVAGGTGAADAGLFIDLTNGLQLKQVTESSTIRADTYGIVDDFDYAGGGAATGTDNGTAIRAAVATALNVQFPAGSFGLTGAVELNPQQQFLGVGGPQRGAKERPSVTELIWMSDTDGLSTETNDANGAQIKNFVLRAGYQGSVTSTQSCLNLGEEGAVGGTSSQIKTVVEDVLTFDWFTGCGIHGFGYETICRNVLHSSFIQYGFKVTDQSNIVSLYDCGGLNSNGLGGDAKAFFIAEAHAVGIYTPRMENNRVGIEVEGGASVNMYNAYFEGNRIIDMIMNDDGSQLNVDGARVFHENDGVTTTAIVQINSTCTADWSVTMKNIRVLVTKGAVGNDNDLTQFVLNNGTNGYHEYKNIDWQAVGNVWAGTGSDPDLLTLRQLPYLEVKTRGVGSAQSVSFVNTTITGSPLDSVFTLTNFDATTQLVGKSTGARVYRVDTSTVDFYYWTGAVWTPSNK